MKNRITEILAKKGKSKGWLARVTGISRPYITRVSKGEVTPTLYTAFKIRHVLGCLVEEIWPDEEE